MGAPGMGVELEEGDQRLVSRFGARGLAHMHGATISALHGDGDSVLGGQRLTQCAPAVVDAMALSTRMFSDSTAYVTDLCATGWI